MNCLKSFESALALKCRSSTSIRHKEERLVHTSVGRFEKDKRNHYEVLKIGKNSSAKEIRDAFIKLSKENHPDKNQADPKNHEKFVRINEAYSVLSQARSRSDYDRSLWRPQARTVSSNFHSGGSSQFYRGSPGQSEFYGGFSGQYSRRPGYDPFRRVAEEYIFNETMKRAREAAARERNEDGSPGVQKKSNVQTLLMLLGLSLIAGYIQLVLVSYANGSMNDRFKVEEDKYNTLLSGLELQARTHGNRYIIDHIVHSHDETGVDLSDLKDEDTKN